MIATIAKKKIRYDILGKKGSAVLFVHGWGGSGESLRALAALASQNHKAILVDLPGFGGSDNPEPDWGVEEYTQVVSGLLEYLKIGKVIYFGHSFGGSVGLHLTTSTQKVSKLILCNSSYRRSVKKSRFAMAIKQVIPEHKALRRLFYRIFFRNSDLARYPHLESNFRKIILQDMAATATKVAVPTLIIWGENDTITPVEYARDLQAKIRRSHLVIVPGARHSLPLSDPKIVFQTMLKKKFI